jgi:TPR repeat protein
MSFLSRPLLQWLAKSTLFILALIPICSNAGMTPEEIKTFQETKVVAAKGDAIAQDLLGYYYMFGEGVAQSRVNAFKWWLKAAKQGEEDAQDLVGGFYEVGVGNIRADYVEAVKWYRKSAGKFIGYANAQYHLGVCYQKGKGVVKDCVEAVKWYRKAADQGHTPAQLSLGNLYLDGESVSKDEIEAYAYFNLAGITNQDARKALARLEARMTLEDQLKGQQRTKELQKEMEARNASKSFR